MKRIIVIGGGASGLMAAYTCAAAGVQVLLIEKNEKLGKKLYLTGKGRCNLTNDCSPDEFLENTVRGRKFLTGAAWTFSSHETMEFFSSHGLALKTERGKRVFPQSDHASDVTKTLEKACKEVGVRIHLDECALKINILQGTVSGIITSKTTYSCDSVVVATGGLSYPATGSTGDGYRFATAAGHKITECVPSLVGINLRGDLCLLNGLHLKNVRLSAERNRKTIFSEQGEVLFLHDAVSGPLVLSLSALINRISPKELMLFLDLKPALDEATLEARLLRDFAARGNEPMKDVIRGLLPAGLSLSALREAHISSGKSANAVTRDERLRLMRILKRYPLEPVSLRGFEEAVITSGGVCLDEINPKTMESKLVRGLYFCGETLDVDAFTGGFNLQIAFSTGFLAGRAAAL